MAGDKKHIDKLSGVETTGHKWDGIEELNNPMPRWWLWTFYICCIVAFVYMVLYPSWPIPGGSTKGTLGWTKYNKFHKEQAELEAHRDVYLKKFSTLSLEQVQKDEEMLQFAKAGGFAAFKDNCAMCHGLDAAGKVGFFPNLNDDDWLWGGSLQDIYQTLQHGIRTEDPKTRFSQMPSFGRDGLLTREQISDVADFVISLNKGADWNSKGAVIFKEQCVTCHGPEGKGDRSQGAPNLTDAIWFFGGDKDSVVYTITNARNNQMPGWSTRLDENTIKQLTIYVHSLGGGE